MVNDDLVYVHVPAECDAYPGAGRDRRVDYQRCVGAAESDSAVYLAMGAKIFKYHHYVIFASFVLDGDVAYLVAHKKLAIDYEGPDAPVVEDIDEVYDFEASAMMHDRKLRVPEAMRDRVRGDGVVFYEPDQLPASAAAAAATLVPPEDKFRWEFSGDLGKLCGIALRSSK